MLTDSQRDRYFVSSGDTIPRRKTTWHIVDWDQRRTFGLTVDQYRFDEELAVEYLHNHVDQIEADACHLFIAPDGQLLRTSANPEDDVERCVEFFPVADHHLAPGISTICRSQLEELDRLGANVDLVSYREDGASQPKQVAFKYYFVSEFQNRVWDEMYLWMRLPKHPNIMAFDRVVTEELEGRVVGFTSRFIKGDTLEKNTSRLFRLNHLQQLMDLVDELNLKYRVAHQDLAPRNLLLDAETDRIMLFDFDNSAGIGQRCYREDRNDVKGLVFTLYEVITEDMSFRSVPFDEQNIDDILTREDWPKQTHVRLDHPVSDYRALVTNWASGRLRDAASPCSSAGPGQDAIVLPAMPDGPLRAFETFTRDGNGNRVSNIAMRPRFTFRRAAGEKRGRRVVSWARPSRSRLANGARLLATGQRLPDA